MIEIRVLKFVKRYIVIILIGAIISGISLGIYEKTKFRPSYEMQTKYALKFDDKFFDKKNDKIKYLSTLYKELTTSSRVLEIVYEKLKGDIDSIDTLKSMIKSENEDGFVSVKISGEDKEYVERVSTEVVKSVDKVAMSITNDKTMEVISMDDSAKLINKFSFIKYFLVGFFIGLFFITTLIYIFKYLKQELDSKDIK